MEEQERIIFEGRVPWRAYHGAHGVAWLVLIGWNVGILISLYEKLSCYLKLTSWRVQVVSGLVAQHEEQVDLFRVTDTQVTQGVVDRLLGVGAVRIISEDRTSPELSVRIHKPRYYAEELKKCVVVERRKRRAVAMD
ncbi:MAG: PH domain-containing protein [Thermodesulfobacteriota bacterium]